MKKIIGLFLAGVSLVAVSCGGGDKKTDEGKKQPEGTSAAAKNFNAEADAAPGNAISELSFVEKQGDKEVSGKRITKFFEDSSKVVVTVYKKANDEVYDAEIYTISKAEAKNFKADLTPMNDGSDNYTTYNPKDFGAVSLVFVADGGTADTKIITSRSLSIFMDEKKDETTKENGFNMPVPDFKTADEWVKKLAASFKK